IEIGPSAGLNLIWDRYGVRYTHDGRSVAIISPEAELVLDCELKGGRTPPMDKTPLVGSRVGLERNPVDLTNQDDRDWLRALIWPDEVARMRRFERAFMLAQKAGPEIRKGDALELLPDALAEVPANETACVYHTIAVYQF